MNIMTKRGNLDNVVTYEHICDTVADMDKINPNYITLGSTCIVIKGENGLEAYMADSNKKWTPVSFENEGSGEGGSESITIDIHPDWLENDESSPNYIANRPGGYKAEGYNEITVVDQIIEVEKVPYQTKYRSNTSIVPLVSIDSTSVGTINKIYYDGVVYEAEYTEGNMGYFYVLATISEGVGVCFECSPDQGITLNQWDIIDSLPQEGGNHTVKWVTVQTESFVPFAKEYYPIDWNSGQIANQPLIFNNETLYSDTDCGVNVSSSVAKGRSSFAVNISKAFGDYSHAEGSAGAVGNYSHAEGQESEAMGECSHAEGYKTYAQSRYSHAEGYFTRATNECQHVFGKYNTSAGTYDTPAVEIVGWGSYSSPKNIRTLDSKGNEYLAGSLTLGSTELTEDTLKKLIALLN